MTMLSAWWLDTIVVSAALALLAWTSSRLRLGTATLRHGLWMVALIKFVTPPLLFWPNGTTSEVASIASLAAEAPRPAGDPAVPLASLPTPIPRGDSIETAWIATPTAVASSPRVVGTPRQPLAPRWSWGSRERAGLVTVVIGLAFIGLLQQARAIGRAARRLRDGMEPPEWILELVADEARRIGVAPPRVLLLADSASPLLWCGLPSTLVLPEHDALGDQDQAVQLMVLHELAHLRRGDPWMERLLALAAVVWWWNPVFRWVRANLRQEADLACDAWVVADAPKLRQAYASLLVDVCGRCVHETSTVLSRSMTSPTTRMERRLTMILRDTRHPRAGWTTRLLVLGMMGLAAPVGLLVQSPDTRPSSSATTPTPRATRSARDPNINTTASAGATTAVTRPPTITLPAVAEAALEPLAELRAITETIPASAAGPAHSSDWIENGSVAESLRDRIADLEGRIDLQKNQVRIKQLRVQATELALRAAQRAKELAESRVSKGVTSTEEAAAASEKTEAARIAVLEAQAEVDASEIEVRNLSRERDIRAQQLKKWTLSQATPAASRPMSSGSRSVNASPLVAPSDLAPASASAPARYGVSSQPRSTSADVLLSTTRNVASSLPPAHGEDERSQAVLAALESTIVTDLANEMALSVLFAQLEEAATPKGQTESPLQFYIDPEATTDSPLKDAQVRVQVRKLPARTALALALNQLRASYMVRDGLIIVSTIERLHAIDGSLSASSHPSAAKPVNRSSR